MVDKNKISKQMDIFDCHEHAPVDIDCFIFEKMALGTTCEHEEELVASLHHDQFLESEEIGLDAFATFYTP
jgi:hypothetical protein